MDGGQTIKFIRNLAMSPSLKNWALLQIERQQAGDSVRKGLCEYLLKDSYVTTKQPRNTGDYAAKSVPQLISTPCGTYKLMGAMPMSDGVEAYVWGKISPIRINVLFETPIQSAIIESQAAALGLQHMQSRQQQETGEQSE